MNLGEFIELLYNFRLNFFYFFIYLFFYNHREKVLWKKGNHHLSAIFQERKWFKEKTRIVSNKINRYRIIIVMGRRTAEEY